MPLGYKTRRTNNGFVGRSQQPAELPCCGRVRLGLTHGVSEIYSACGTLPRFLPRLDPAEIGGVFHPKAFAPETIKPLDHALRAAWVRIQGTSAVINERAEAARDTLAKCVVNLAREDERSQQRFVEDAPDPLPALMLLMAGDWRR